MRKKLTALTALLLAVILPAVSLAAGLSFSTTTLAGKKIDSSIMKEYRLIMVNFWAEWCNPCVNEMPDLQQLYAEDDELLILGVWIGSYESLAKQTAKQCGVKYPLLKRAGGLNTLYNLFDAIPATFFFDSNGKQLGDKNGYIGSRSYYDWKDIITDLKSKAQAPAKFSYTSGGLKYKLDPRTKTAVVTGAGDNSATELTIPATVKSAGGISYRVTGIKKNAFKGMAKLAKATVGKNIKKIGAGAFSGCRKLKNLILKTAKLLPENVGENAFRNLYKKVTVKCPKAALETYRAFLYDKGLPKKARIR